MKIYWNTRPEQNICHYVLPFLAGPLNVWDAVTIDFCLIFTGPKLFPNIPPVGSCRAAFFIPC